MDLFQTITLWIGLALCAMALLQLALWSTQSLSLHRQNKKQFELSRQLLRKQIESSTPKSQTVEQPVNGAWNGFRPFRVAKLFKETELCTSVYLQPEDGKPIADFQPGQHLTFKFNIPGESKPIVRCYSLSDGPGKDYYRISVKSVAAPKNKPELPPGRASNFINLGLREGDRVEAKSPSGHFVLDETSNQPVILLGGGIGITPMVSIVDRLLEQKSDRPILLMYGVRNGTDHAFKEHFAALAQADNHFQVLTCYSNPDEKDVVGKDYHVAGHASVEFLKQVLTSNECQYYICGPPPFMNSLYDGLLEWGVHESQIFFEAFGPASIGKAKKKNAATPTAKTGAQVKFANSDMVRQWDSKFESFLELAEANDIMIDSGCRAGSCGTCATDLISGKVIYPDPDQVACELGQCLVCIAKPDGPVELDA